jgi:hypothetical protein
MYTFHHSHACHDDTHTSREHKTLLHGTSNHDDEHEEETAIGHAHEHDEVNGNGNAHEEEKEKENEHVYEEEKDEKALQGAEEMATLPENHAA